MIGTYVVVRCYSAGVHAGTLESVDGEIAVLTGARRLWRWRCPQGVALNGVATFGLSGSDCKVDTRVERVRLSGVIEVIATTKVAEDSINGWQ